MKHIYTSADKKFAFPVFVSVILNNIECINIQSIYNM
jgi:hypothetical protein